MRFELRAADEGGTLLLLEHGRIEAPLGMAYMSRWSGVLARIEAEVAR